MRKHLSRIKSSLVYQIDKRRKWPSEVYINMTSRCNANCVFCSINHKLTGQVPDTTLENIKKMTWLKHARFIGLWCGNGEPLLNEEFGDILDYINATYPKATTHLSTNGILLDYTTANKLDYINVSLNAANTARWKEVVRGLGVLELMIFNLASVRRPKAKSISFVVYKDNMHQLSDFVKVAHDCGASAIIGHCMFHSWTGDRKLPVEKSVYNYPAAFNAELALAHKKARELGVALYAPPPIGSPHYICRGTPVTQYIPICPDPFKRLYLTIDELGKPSAVVCCSGVYFDVPYDMTNMTPEALQEIWHNPAFETLRRTANRPKTGGNFLCRWCKSIDRYTPEASGSYYRIVERVKRGELCAD